MLFLDALGDTDEPGDPFPVGQVLLSILLLEPGLLTERRKQDEEDEGEPCDEGIERVRDQDDPRV